MTDIWAILFAVLLGLLIIAILAVIVTFAIYVINRVFDELMKN